jgi:[ribosomal protein S5]-alanine N-acetyltransferase
VAIRTQRLLLRAPALGDARAIAELAGDYEVASMTGTIPHPYSEDMAVDWIESLQEGEEGVAFAVDLGGALIGCVGYRATEKDHAEMGYWIGKPYWGMGYATEAARALILYAFEKEGFAYLTVGHFKENPASARVIAKLGFEPSGEVLRDCAARNNKARCLTYRLTRERALANLRPGLEASSLSPAERGLG